MYGHYQTLSQWREQAHNYINDEEGQKLLDLDEHRELVPYVPHKGKIIGVLSYIGWGSGHRSVRHIEDLQNTCMKAAEKAEGFARQLGLHERITEPLETLDWNHLTMADLANALDGVLMSSSAGLLKAQDSIDHIISLYRAVAEGSLAKSSLDASISEFSEQLNVSFNEFHQGKGEDTLTDLRQFCAFLENSVNNALITTGDDPNHAFPDAMISAANQIDDLFKEFLNKKTDEASGSNPALQDNLQQDQVETAYTMEYEPPVIPQQVENLPSVTAGEQASPSPDLTTIKGQVKAFAQNTIINEEPDQYCQQLLRDVKHYLVSSSTSIDKQIEQLDHFTTWLTEPIEAANKKEESSGVYLQEELQFPLFEYREELSKVKHLSHGHTPLSVPPLESSITENELLAAGLVSDQQEYQELCTLMSSSYMLWPGVIPRLQAFRSLQKFNSGMTNHHFRKLMSALNDSTQDSWTTSMIQCQHTTHPYRAMIPHVQLAVDILARAKNIRPYSLDVLPLLDMDGLSAPYLLRQLEALNMFSLNLSDDALTLQEMAYVINHNILKPFMIGKIVAAWKNPQELPNLNNSLRDEINKRQQLTDHRKQDYLRQNISTKTEADFGLTPWQVPANDDCFFSAIGHLMGEPMRNVRERCHNTACDLMTMADGQFEGDHSSYYAQRLTVAARNLNDDQLQALRGKIADKTLLTPSFERQDKKSARGENDDLAVVALTYNYPVIPIASESGCDDYYAYLPDGSQYQSAGDPDAVKYCVRQSGEAPMMLLSHNRHWDPLVAYR